MEKSRSPFAADATKGSLMTPCAISWRRSGNFRVAPDPGPEFEAPLVLGQLGAA